MKLLSNSEAEIHQWFSDSDTDFEIQFACEKLIEKASLCLTKEQIFKFQNALSAKVMSARTSTAIDKVLRETQVAVLDSRPQTELSICFDQGEHGAAVASTAGATFNALIQGAKGTPNSRETRSDFFHRTIGKYLPFARRIVMIDRYLATNIAEEAEHSLFLFHEFVNSGAKVEIHSEDISTHEGRMQRKYADHMAQELIRNAIPKSTKANDIIVCLYRRKPPQRDPWIMSENVVTTAHDRLVQIQFDRGVPLTLALGQGSETFSLNSSDNGTDSVNVSSAVYGPLPNSIIDEMFSAEARSSLFQGAAHRNAAGTTNGINKWGLRTFAKRNPGLIAYS